jgi:hypothetical protein
MRLRSGRVTRCPVVGRLGTHGDFRDTRQHEGDDVVVSDEDGLPVVPKYRQRTWVGLSWSEQRAVLRAARRGLTHPDPAVAKAARDWAREVRAPRPPSRGLRNFLLTLVEDPFGGTLGLKFSERRAARRILAVKPPMTD